MATKTATELLDELEYRMKLHPLCLWDGVGQFPGGKAFGLSLKESEMRLLRILVVQVVIVSICFTIITLGAELIEIAGARILGGGGAVLASAWIALRLTRGGRDWPWD